MATKNVIGWRWKMECLVFIYIVFQSFYVNIGAVLVLEWAFEYKQNVLRLRKGQKKHFFVKYWARTGTSKCTYRYHYQRIRFPYLKNNNYFETGWGEGQNVDKSPR